MVRAHIVVAVHLGEMQTKLRAQMEELFKKHGLNAHAAAEEIWGNKQRYPEMSSDRVPIAFFARALQSGSPYDVLESLPTHSPASKELTGPILEAYTEVKRASPESPDEGILYGVVNKVLIASDYLKYAQEWSKGQSPLQQTSVSPTKSPYAITTTQAPGTPDEISRDVSEYVRGKKFASDLIQAVINRYLSS
jgi:hypothetical protein